MTEEDINCEVLMIDPVAGSNAWNYLCILRTPEGDAVPVGRTYNTGVQARKGDIIRVSLKNMNMYTDKKTGETWFNWAFPKVIEKREDRSGPDTAFSAKTLNKKTQGKTDQKKWPRRYREEIGLEIKGVDKFEDVDFPTSGKFALSHICWRGQMVVRPRCSRQEWHLFLEMGSKALDIIMDQNPTENPSVPATIGKPKPSKVLTQEGKLPNKSDLNPDKKTAAFLKILETGTFKTLEDTPTRKVIEFEGGQFRGKYELLQEKTKNLWNLKKTDGKQDASQ